MLRVLLEVAAVGIGATAVMDLYALALRRAFGVASLDYRFVGRWIGHMPKGRFAHSAIRAAAPVHGERALGWTAHYAIGVIFAAALDAVVGPEWLARPTPGPALLAGLATVTAPFFLMQPGMGLGIAASRTPKPGTARLRSLANHLVFGAGLYLSALVLAAR